MKTWLLGLLALTVAGCLKPVTMPTSEAGRTCGLGCQQLQYQCAAGCTGMGWSGSSSFLLALLCQRQCNSNAERCVAGCPS